MAAPFLSLLWNLPGSYHQGRINGVAGHSRTRICGAYAEDVPVTICRIKLLQWRSIMSFSSLDNVSIAVGGKCLAAKVAGA